MTTLIKLTLALIIGLIPNDSQSSYEAIESFEQTTYALVVTTETPKQKAYHILENKCNVCHTSKNKRRVFTPDNMDDWANDVYKQVFVKRRMPKGKDIKLNSKEYQDLLTWITSVNSNNS